MMWPEFLFMTLPADAANVALAATALIKSIWGVASLVTALRDEAGPRLRGFRFSLGHFLIADATFDWTILLILLSRPTTLQLWELLICAWPSVTAILAFVFWGRESVNGRKV